MFFLVYKITNKINGKIYIGAHRTNNLDDEYMGSGKYIQNAVKKYGKENFTKEILYQFDNEEDMFSKEAEIVDEEFIKRKDTYNLIPGGFGSDMKKPTQVFMEKMSDPHYYRDFCNKCQKNFENNPKIRENISKGLLEHYKTHKGTFTGKHHTEETKQKLRDLHKLKGLQKGCKNSQYGKHWIINPETEEKKSIHPEQLQEYLDKGWIMGRTLNPKSRNRLPKEERIQLIKEQNKKVRETRGKQYLFTNKITGEIKVLFVDQIKDYDNNWESPFYTLDQNKEYIRQQLLQGKTIQDISIEFNIGYHNVYSWYRKFGKDIKQELDRIRHEKKLKVCK